MKTNVQTKLAGLLIAVSAIFFSIFLSNCKGHVEIFGITDSITNCSPPYVVYFYPDAEHRRKDLEYTWDFGDGTQSHDQEAVHIYQEHGLYDVTLSIKQNKSFDSKTIPLYLTIDSTAPEAKWDYFLNTDSLWAPSKVYYLNDSEHATDFYWEFGDGDTSHMKVPDFHIFDTPGTFATTLNAVCGGDTSKFSRDMIIKNSPNVMWVNEVTVWMPSAEIGSDLKLEVWYDGHRDFESGWVTGVASYPITFNIETVLFLFDGIYDRRKLEFIVFLNGDPTPEIIFDVEARDLQSDFYPMLLSFDDGYGRALESTVGYRN
ncbi:MAG: PKD domain-containing protein [Bacteroidales bacterium]|nr:PKD domain-containing protein [Bacteroidales bacterium]